MCIICNLTGQEGLAQADDFLRNYRRAAELMKTAEADLLAVSAHVTPEAGRRYRAVQKQMARLRRQWNCIEHEREAQAQR